MLVRDLGQQDEQQVIIEQDRTKEQVLGRDLLARLS